MPWIVELVFPFRAHEATLCSMGERNQCTQLSSPDFFKKPNVCASKTFPTTTRGYGDMLPREKKRKNRGYLVTSGAFSCSLFLLPHDVLLERNIPGWSAPLLFASNKARGFHVKAHMMLKPRLHGLRLAPCLELSLVLRAVHPLYVYRKRNKKTIK